jgi:hypothetical protein
MVAMDWKIARPRCWTPPPRVADGRRGPYVLARQQQSTHGIFPERHSTIGDARVAISCYKFYPNTAAVARGPDDRVCNHLPLRRERRARPWRLRARRAFGSYLWRVSSPLRACFSSVFFRRTTPSSRFRRFQRLRFLVLVFRPVLSLKMPKVMIYLKLCVAASALTWAFQLFWELRK